MTQELIFQKLQTTFDSWEALLTTLTEEEIVTPQPSSGWSIKDELAHLWAWQQVSIARLEAAAENRAPIFPEWLEGKGPEDHAALQQFNDRIYRGNRDKSWQEVHTTWREGFRKFMVLGQAIPTADLHDTLKYPWLNGYPLHAVLEGSLGHHTEHLETLEARWGSYTWPIGVAAPAQRALASIGVTRLEQVTRFTEAELTRLHGMGPKALRIIKEALAAEGKTLKGEPNR